MNTMQLAAAAVRLRESSPVAWEDFVKQIRIRTAEAAQQMVGASADNIFKAQGRAMAWQELTSELISAPAVIEKANAKRKE